MEQSLVYIHEVMCVSVCMCKPYVFFTVNSSYFIANLSQESRKGSQKCLHEIWHSVVFANKEAN